MTADPSAGPAGPGAPGTTQATLAGSWENQLGSRLELEADDDGRLTGTYRTGVGDGHEVRPLAGWWHPWPAGGRAIAGFTVSWPASDTVSVWAGQLDPGTDTIDATWLMVGDAPPADAWRSTSVGHDHFHRVGSHA